MLNERLRPGAMTPPKYILFFITSKVVAVPKSIIIVFLDFLRAPIALAILSDPTCFLFTDTSIYLLIFNCFN